MGPIFELEKDGFNYRWFVRPHGINIWLTVEGAKYLSSDSGMCTKRGDYNAALSCDDIIFENFPQGHNCEKEKENDLVIPGFERPECDAQLLKEATAVCNKCPDVVAPQGCVTETCILGAIEFAEEQVRACGIKPLPKNTCGRVGRIRKKGSKKFAMAKHETACECREACKVAGGLEWQFKAKKNKCGCYKGAQRVSYKKGDITDRKKRIVGALTGSQASVTEEQDA